jgi:hypothetical protein
MRHVQPRIHAITILRVTVPIGGTNSVVLLEEVCVSIYRAGIILNVIILIHFSDCVEYPQYQEVDCI